MSTTIRLGLVVATLWATTIRAEPADQIRTLFAGDWIALPGEPASRPPGLAGPWAAEVKLTQDYSALTVEYISSTGSGAPVKLIYNLNGTELRSLELNAGEPRERVTRAIGQGRDLILKTIWPRVDPGPIEITEVLSLTEPDTLSVTLTRRVKDDVATGVWLFRRR